MVKLFEELVEAEVSLSCIAENGDDRGGRAEFAGDVERNADGCARADSDEQSFISGEGDFGIVCSSIRDGANFVDEGWMIIGRDEPCGEALNFRWTTFTARNRGARFGFDGNDARGGFALFEDFADAADGAAKTAALT